MNNWNKSTLGSEVKFLSGGTPKKDIIKYWVGNIPWVSSSEMTQRRIYDTQFHVSADGAREGSRIVPLHTILVVVRGMSLAKEFRVAITKKEVTFNQDLKALIPKTNIYNQFLFYYLLSQNEAIKDSASEAAHGTKKIDMPVLEHWPLPIPPLPIQRKIAAVLSAYDDLIENNNRRIAILEKMAEELYREWFVRLRFPGHEKVKIVKGVPEGWEIKKIGDIYDIQYGKNLPTEMIGNEGRYPVYGAGGVLGYYSKKNTDYRTTLITCRGNGSGTVWRTLQSETFITNNNFKIKLKLFKPDAEMFFSYFHLKFSSVDQAISGSAQPQITIDGLSKIKTIMPIQPEIYAFVELIKPLFENIDHLKLKNTVLINTRDRLLTRLMSGKIDLEKLDIHFPQSMLEETAGESVETPDAIPSQNKNADTRR